VGKKENLRITTIQDGEKQRLRGAEKERQQEARKLERMKLTLFETGKEMMKSEKLKESELQTAKTPYDTKEQTKDPSIPTIKVNFSK